MGSYLTKVREILNSDDDNLSFVLCIQITSLECTPTEDRECLDTTPIFTVLGCSPYGSVLSRDKSNTYLKRQYVSETDCSTINSSKWITVSCEEWSLLVTNWISYDLLFISLFLSWIYRKYWSGDDTIQSSSLLN